MILARFDTASLTRVRFAISPSLELIRSTRVLHDPAAAALHLPWIERARQSTRGLDLSLLRALQRSEVYNPDFVHPPPDSPVVCLEDELEVMMATPAEQISAEVRYAYADRELPAVLEPFVSDPGRAIAELAEQMRLYWKLCLEEDWPRIRSLLEQDVLHRARQIADGGVRRLFADLDPGVSWQDGELSVECCGDCEEIMDLDDRGLLLVPSVFVWPVVTLVSAAPWQPTLIYPARGVGMLWSPEQSAPPDALDKLLGHTRATLLVSLDSPRSTTELAGALGLTPGGVSQHLAVMRDAGLLHGRRVGRSVLYSRSSGGDDLLTAAGADGESGVAGSPVPGGAALL